MDLNDVVVVEIDVMCGGGDDRDLAKTRQDLTRFDEISPDPVRSHQIRRVLIKSGNQTPRDGKNPKPEKE